MSADIQGPQLRAALHRAADMVADYLERVGDYPVLPRVEPGEVAALFPVAAPERGESLDRILDDYRELIEPNVTHWNHPGFLAYFAITGSGPGILGELLTAGLNVNAMLWRTSPAATELEERVCDWVRQAVGLPAGFRGHLNDTASIATLLALAVARHRLEGLDVRRLGLAGRQLPTLVAFASEQAHSSVDKAAITLGLGLENLRRLPVDGAFRMRPEHLEEAVEQSRRAGELPFAVVATAGTTSTTSVDPLPEIAAICRRHGLWLHVDAAYAGAAAICPELRQPLRGWEAADSIVLNPHKWLFTPLDCSLLLVRDLDLWRQAFSLVPEYLRTSDEGVSNLMDLGVQLGRRFRALKLWMVLRAFGLEGLRQRIRDHVEMARVLAARIEEEPSLALVAPVPFSTVCFRLVADGPSAQRDQLNQQLLDEINAAGPFLVSHTRLDGELTLRVAIGNLRTTPEVMDDFWRLLRARARELAGG